VGGTLQSRGNTQFLKNVTTVECELSKRDPTLAMVIASQSTRWPSEPTEDPIWGLVRIVMAQQVSTLVACRIAERARSMYPDLITPSSAEAPDASTLRAIGLSQRRA